MIDGIKGAKGVSCVEIYLLALLSFRNIDERCLYSDSYIGIGETLNEFIGKRRSYASYLGKPRLQTVAKELGLISLQTFERGTQTHKFDHILYEVSPSYKKGGALAPWRADHYLLWHENAFYDCYPPSRLTVKEVFNDLADTCIGIDIHADAALPDIKECTGALVKSIPKATEKIGVALTPDNLVFVRDALLYVKVMRERMNGLLQLSELDALIKAVAKFVARIELFRQRKIIGAYQNLVEEIDEKERLWKEKISKM